MGWIPELSRRRRRPELMDRPDLDRRRHLEALRALARIHRLSRSAGILWRHLRPLAAPDAATPLRVLDVATGGGDLAIRVWKRARRASRPVEVDGCDVSPVAVERARERAAGEGADVEFFALDAVRSELPTRYDVIMSSLFLHHLDDDTAVDFLARASRSCGRRVVTHDLVRSRLGYVLAWLASRLLSRSRIVRTDALRSVEAAFRPRELHRRLSAAGFDDVGVHRHWPQRFVLTLPGTTS